MERGPSGEVPKGSEARINPQLAVTKAITFLKRFKALTPAEKRHAISLHSRNGHGTNSPQTDEAFPYIVSESPEQAKGKPTIVLFPGIFRTPEEMAVDLAVIAHVFDAHVIVIDYPSLAAGYGMKGLLQKLPSVLESTESDRNPPPSRIVIGESLGGLVAQAVTFASESEPQLQQRLNIKHLVLSHTVPPELVDKRLVFFARFLRLFGPNVPMSIARPLISTILDHAHRRNLHEEDQTLLDAEWAAVHDILRKERTTTLTSRRGSGYVRSALGAIDESRKQKAPTEIPTDIILSKSDRLFKTIPSEVWERYHKNSRVVELEGPHGHATSVLKETYLARELIPMLARILPVAA